MRFLENSDPFLGDFPPGYRLGPQSITLAHSGLGAAAPSSPLAETVDGIGDARKDNRIPHPKNPLIMTPAFIEAP
jgi:hypothetical protein